LKNVCLSSLLALIISLYDVQPALSNDPPKFILIHVDAVSGIYLEQELEKGNLPNLYAYFGDHGIVDYAITYFPSKTPTVISSLRFGDTIREADLPGWEYVIDRAEGTVVKTVGTFLRMIFSTSRLSRTNILYGVPFFHWLAGPALVNTADYLKDYHVVQFYWFNIDTHGHFFGEEEYLNAYRDFDRQFGRLIKRIDDDVNVIVYSDHGMTFGRGVEIDLVIEKLVDDDLKLYSYPSLYLTDREKAGYYAKRVLKETELDFTFYKPEEDILKGYHKDATLLFYKNQEEQTIRYEYSGHDVLGYYDKGYSGEYLNQYEWLELTHQFEYPLAPVVLYHSMDNPGSGDLITLFEGDKYNQTGYGSSGNHGGFVDKDMRSILMVRGPEVAKLYNRKYYWLPDLFNDIQGVDFERRPPRERHVFSSRYDFRRNRTVTGISASPLYRMNYGLTAYNTGFSHLTDFDRIDIWGKADLFRSYISRFWVGTGLELTPDEVNPLFILQYDIHFRKFVFQNSFATNRPFYFRVSYEATPWLAIETVNFTSLGFRIDF
jgi:hypothetical protein